VGSDFQYPELLLPGFYMLEHAKDRLLPRAKFILRMLISVVLGIVLTLIALGIGMIGYHHYEKMGWIDSFANASMILSGMGPLSPLQTDGGKLFAGFYALFSGLAFILIVGIILAPVVHRIFHQFHIAEGTQDRLRK
jgi:hypothetical protein